MRIETALAHEGEDHSNDKQVESISLNSTATTITYVILILVVLIGAFLLLYHYGKRNRK